MVSPQPDYDERAALRWAAMVRLLAAGPMLAAPVLHPNAGRPSPLKGTRRAPQSRRRLLKPEEA